ncbi:PREDICTED: nuclear factor erythroid 2-related factor 1-like isoform X1 [Branchiostoma belcheri]|uniref:Nuclear factor erythroid 2-related factor 1-like isoform X1 n=1 Tax=Branchiostoma belcheri TaxID=7741 RepID=A0A6P4ZM90_BRABE|nr:PREDICTED: nuclear factor erythroid 2-related factor 1-like isoform X1 [Branchiostoma belcheri]
MVKKHFYDGLVQLAILFSLLGTDINSYLNSQDQQNQGISLTEIIQGQNLALTQSPSPFNPNLLTGYLNLKSAHHDRYEREREILQELHQLKPSSKAFPLDITALLLEGGLQTEEGTHATAEEPTSQGAEPNLGHPANDEVEGATGPSPVGDLTKEDMDLIKVLWQQDIDLGAGLEVFDAGLRQQELEKQRALEKEKEECSKAQEWQEGVDYFVDSETGEHIPLPPRQPEMAPQQPSTDPIMTMDQCMQYLQNMMPVPESEQPQVPSPPATVPDLDQTLQDLASIEELGLGLPQQYSYSHNTQDTVSQPSPVSNINTNVSLVNAINATLDDGLLPAADLPGDDHNLSQMPIMDNFDLNMTQLLLNTDPSEFDQLLSGGMLDDGSLMDVDFNISEAGSDSGLSLHDNETSSMSEHESSSAYDMSSNCDGGSECDMDMLGATGVSRTEVPGVQFEESDAEEGAVGYQPVFKSCGMEAIGNHSYSGNQPGDQPSFQASKEHVNHNHTYPLPPGSEKQHMRRGGSSRRNGTPPRGSDNNGKGGRRRSKDERRAKQLKVPFSIDRIIFTPVDDFNDMLTQHPLTDAQLQLIRDIRRRGKNKIAAQNCRKRKIDTIYTLDDDVKQLMEDKERLIKERGMIDKNLRTMREKFDKLYEEVFRSLRDDNGQPYSPDEFSLQQTSDGNVFLVPTNSTVSSTATRTNPKGKKRKGSKNSK